MSLLMAALFVLNSLLWLIGSVVSAIVGYLLFLTIMAWWASRDLPGHSGMSEHRFAILVPAHNEEQLLPNLLANLKTLDYPAANYTIYVVADNCTDGTAAVARQAGATVYERNNTDARGKGYALQWLLQQLQAHREPFDAALILDADSIVSANFLQVMDQHLSGGAQVIQAYYGVLAPARSWATSLRAMSLAVLHYVRPLGRTPLGASTGLKGNGMVFRRAILQEHQWSASITEDIEYHMTLLLSGVRVHFAPTAVVWAEMPGALANSWTQNSRWEQGRLEMARRYVPQLLAAAWRKAIHSEGALPAFTLVDAAIEHLIPPFSLVILLNGGFLALALSTGSHAATVVALCAIVGQLLYLSTGLILTKAPYQVYRNLIYLPFFIVWKLWLYLSLLFGPKEEQWIRTTREAA